MKRFHSSKKVLIKEHVINCLNKYNFPLEQKWPTRNIVHKAKVTSCNQNYQDKVYFGLSKTTFKNQFPNDKNSFNLHKYKIKQSYQTKSGE